MFRNPYDLMWVISEHRFNIMKPVKRIEAPVSIVYGGKDDLCHIETGLKIYEALGMERTDVELTTFPNCGHFPHLEKPELTANHILEFVKKHCNYDKMMAFGQPEYFPSQ